MIALDLIKLPSKRKTRGVAALEFALTFPLLASLTIGICEFGRAFWIWDSLQEAVNVTGRYAMYNPSASNAALSSYFTGIMQAVPASSVTLSYGNSTTGTVTFTSITATYQFTPLTQLVNLSVPLISSARVPRI